MLVLEGARTYLIHVTEQLDFGISTGSSHRNLCFCLVPMQFCPKIASVHVEFKGARKAEAYKGVHFTHRSRLNLVLSLCGRVCDKWNIDGNELVGPDDRYRSKMLAEFVGRHHATFTSTNNYTQPTFTPNSFYSNSLLH